MIFLVKEFCSQGIIPAHFLIIQNVMSGLHVIQIVLKQQDLPVWFLVKYSIGHGHLALLADFISQGNSRNQVRLAQDRRMLKPASHFCSQVIGNINVCFSKCSFKMIIKMILCIGHIRICKIGLISAEKIFAAKTNGAQAGKPSFIYSVYLRKLSVGLDIINLRSKGLVGKCLSSIVLVLQ